MFGPSGIQMLLKSMGFDPVEFGQQITAAKTAAQSVIANFDVRLKALETGQANIEKMLTLIAVSMPSKQPETIAPPADTEKVQ
jgi:hypothetical protein